MTRFATTPSCKRLPESLPKEVVVLEEMDERAEDDESEESVNEAFVAVALILAGLGVLSSSLGACPVIDSLSWRSAVVF